MKLKLYLFGVFMLHSDSSQTAFKEKANEQIMQNKLNLTLEKEKGLHLLIFSDKIRWLTWTSFYYFF